MSWAEHRLGDIVKFRSGGTPSKSEQRYWNGDIPWLSSKDLTELRIHDAPLRVTEVGVENGTRLMPENTVMFVVRGMSLATEFRVSITRRPCTFNQDLKAVECGQNILPDFLFYSLFAQRDRIKGMAGEASHGTKKLETHTIENIKVALPDLDTQRRVIELASAYDDLIENNRRRIALLEEAARMLYREWFVHFRFPGHEHVKFVDGVPEGWRICRLDECVSFQSGGTPSKAKAEYWLGDVPWISSGELTSMRVSTSQLSVTEEAVAEGSRYAEKDTILAVVRGMSLAKEFRVGIASRRVCFNQDIKALVPDRSVEGLFLFHALFDQKDQIRQRAGEASHGTKKLETAVLESLKIVVPSPAIRRHFLDYAEPIHAQWDVLYQQNHYLKTARDLLLPRLMNGEIAV